MDWPGTVDVPGDVDRALATARAGTVRAPVARPARRAAAPPHRSPHGRRGRDRHRAFAGCGEGAAAPRAGRPVPHGRAGRGRAVTRPGGDELRGLGGLVADVEDACAGAPPAPSAELAALLADGLPRARPARLSLSAGVAAKVAAVAMVSVAAMAGAEAADILPASVDRAVRAVIDTVVPFELPGSPSDALQDHEPADAAGPRGGATAEAPRPSWSSSRLATPPPARARGTSTPPRRRSSGPRPSTPRGPRRRPRRPRRPRRTTAVPRSATPSTPIRSAARRALSTPRGTSPNHLPGRLPRRAAAVRPAPLQLPRRRRRGPAHAPLPGGPGPASPPMANAQAPSGPPATSGQPAPTAPAEVRAAAPGGPPGGGPAGGPKPSSGAAPEAGANPGDPG